MECPSKAQMVAHPPVIRQVEAFEDDWTFTVGRAVVACASSHSTSKATNVIDTAPAR